MTGSNRRRRRDQRLPTPRRMRETERDREIVRLVYAYRILSQGQLQHLLGKSRSTIQQALVRLFDHRYLDRVFMPISAFGSSPTLYVLGKRGIELMQREGITDFTGVPNRDVSSYFLEHTLAINQFRITLVRACERYGYRIPVWQTENEIKADYDRVTIKGKRGKTQTAPIVPDSYFVIEVPDRGVSHFFLELDRGTMTLERFRTKVAAYVAYYKKGGYEQRYHAKGFRVLTVVDTPGTGRVAHLVNETTTVEGIGRRFWFAHLPTLIPDTVLAQAVWSVAGLPQPEALFTLS